MAIEPTHLTEKTLTGYSMKVRDKMEGAALKGISMEAIQVTMDEISESK